MNLADERHPSLQKRLRVLSIIMIIVSAPYAIYADFVPNNKVSFYGNQLAIILSIIISLWTFNQATKKNRPHMKSLSITKKTALFISMPFYFYSLLWLFIVHTLPATYTSIYGTYIEVSGECEKTYSQSRRSCDYRIEGDLLSNSFPSYACISKYSFMNKSNKFILSGKKSNVGMLYSNIALTNASS